MAKTKKVNTKLTQLPFGSKPLEEFPKSKYIAKPPKFKFPSKKGRLG